MDGDDPFEPDNEYKKSLPNWLLVNALMSDSNIVRQSGQQFLIKNDIEQQEDYKNRLRRSWLPPGYSEEILRAIGKVFSYEKTIVIQTHPDIEILLNDLDLSGNSIENVAKELFFNLLQYGVGGGLVDYNTELGRPFFNCLSPLNVIGCFEKQNNGVTNLTQIRIVENFYEQKGLYGEQEQERVAVFNINDDGFVTITYFEKGTKGIQQLDEAVVLMNEFSQPFTKFPIDTCSIVSIKKSFFRGSPALLRLAENTMRLYNAQSDLDSLIHIAMVPKFIIKTLDDDVFKSLSFGAQIGSRLNPEDDAMYITGGEKSIECGEIQISRIKDDRRSLGFSSLLQNTGNVTATARALDAVENNSRLAGILGNLKNCLDNILLDLAFWKGIAPEDAGYVSIKTDFSQIISNEDKQQAHLDKMMELWAKGGLSLQSLLTEQKRLGALPDDFDIESEIELIKNEQLEYGN